MSPEVAHEAHARLSGFQTIAAMPRWRDGAIDPIGDQVAKQHHVLMGSIILGRSIVATLVADLVVPSLNYSNMFVEVRTPDRNQRGAGTLAKC